MEEADGNGVIMPPGDICHYFQAFMGFPGGSAGNESTCNVGDLGLKDPLEKGKATYSSILAGRIPWTV